MSKKNSRRTFLKQAGMLSAAAALPLNLVEVAWGKDSSENFSFAYISDAHITHIKGTEFVRNFDKGLKRAVTEASFLSPKPDFVVFGGDLAQLGKKEEIDHGLEMMSNLRYPVRWVIGEHDYYLDLGTYWEDKVSKMYYSFDHKGVHFIVLNSILTFDEWVNRWPTPEERMGNMARLDNPQGSPFMVKYEQIEWMKKDLKKIGNDTPIIVMSHSPLYKIFKPWNFWTEDAGQVQDVLARFDKVTVLHGHVHQILYNQIGNISFQAMMATAWPWPYPTSYSQVTNQMPDLTVMMNRADPHDERDATGWSHIELDDGRVANHLKLWGNTDRTIKYDENLGHPVDTQFQDSNDRIPSQKHY